MSLQAELESLFVGIGYNTSGPRAAAVLAGRFAERRTLRDIGLQFGVTTERIRQIEAKALRILRHQSRREAIERIVAQDSKLWAALFPAK